MTGVALGTDDGATFDREVHVDASTLTPYVTWGTNPAQVVPIGGMVPSPDAFDDPAAREAAERALVYMGLQAGTAVRDIASRHRVYRVVHERPHRGPARRGGRARGPAGRAFGAAPWSFPVAAKSRPQAEAEGLDRVFSSAGFEWRNPGCSMCLAMNPDKLAPGERAASTSNRNFEGRQGRGGRTHLVSPAVAAATAVAGHLRGPGRSDFRREIVMEPVRVVSGTAIPLDRSDVDTDQIIPSDWLKRVERTGFGKGLFSEWRDDRDFVLNKPEHAGATILVAGPNFGTGSSREHAVWALMDYGFKAVDLAPLRRHIPQQLHQGGLGAGAGRCRAAGKALLLAVANDPALEVTVDVERLVVCCARGRDRSGVPARCLSPSTDCSRGSTTSG